MLQIFTALDPALISSFLSTRMRILLPMKAGTSNFGEIMAVARPYINGWTVGKVETAPLQIEYGNGQRRIIHSSLSPSYLSVKESAANLLSRSIRRLTNLDRMVRDTMNEQVDPKTVAVEYSSQPFHIPNIYPDTVPKVDQPTNGGNDTKKTQSHSTKNASLDFSQSSATGANQMNTFPVKIINARPRAIEPIKATTAPILCQRFILRHVRSNRRDIAVARLMIWSRKVAAFLMGSRVELRLLSDGWRHGGRISLYEGEKGSEGEVDRERARAVDM